VLVHTSLACVSKPCSLLCKMRHFIR